MGRLGTGLGWVSNHGYRVFALGKRKRDYEHRIVWRQHYGEIPSGMIVHHKNGNGLDNRIENLELVTRKQHQQHHAPEISRGKLASPISYKPKGSLHHRARFTENDVVMIRERLALGETGKSIAGEFGVWPSAISKIKNRRRWDHC